MLLHRGGVLGYTGEEAVRGLRGPILFCKEEIAIRTQQKRVKKIWLIAGIAAAAVALAVFLGVLIWGLSLKNGSRVFPNICVSGVNIGGRSEESVFLPFSTMQQTLNQGDILHILCVSAKVGTDMQALIDDIRRIMYAQNEIAPDDPQALGVINIAAQFDTFQLLFTGIDILVWLVGMGTLLAGVIGVSNIMMVTVKERTREIGVRRAIGAKPFDIISQVMSESLVLTAVAGWLGLSTGVFLLDLADRILSAQPAGSDVPLEHPGVDIQTAVAATVVLLLSGLLAGLIPAWRAMQIKAIDAIREE